MSERAESAKEMFEGGYNCCQAVVGAYADLFGLDRKTTLRFCEGMGGGMGRMRLTCGAVVAMALLAGMKYGTGETVDLQKRRELYAVIRKMTEEFKQKNGSVICAELLGASKPKDDSPQPEARTADYYKRRPCSAIVCDCALLVEKYLIGQ